ncbi:MAG: DUF1579 domain-containing protein [Planctomycetota bacterium]
MTIKIRFPEMRFFLFVVFLVFVGCDVGLTRAQESAQADSLESEMMSSEPTEQHELLKKFVGTWKSKMGSDGPDDDSTGETIGEMKAKMLGGLWVVCEISIEMPGDETFNAVQTIGFDDKKERYVGTWVDSMTNFMWQYNGRVSKDGKRLVLTAKGPDFTSEGETATFRDSFVFKSSDTILTKSEIKNKDGEWKNLMTGEMTRVGD